MVQLDHRRRVIYGDLVVELLCKPYLVLRIVSNQALSSFTSRVIVTVVYVCPLCPANCEPVQSQILAGLDRF